MTSTLEITTHIGCSNNCFYCPQEILRRKYNGNKTMTTDQFIAILNNTPVDIQIDFAGFCEPFLNPLVSWMIDYAASEGYAVVLDTTLTGFTERDAVILKGAKLKQVFIHDYPGNAVNGDMFDSKVSLLRSSVITEKFEIGKLTSEHLWSRAGNLWPRSIEPGKFECGWTGKDFNRNVVLPNGDVYLCCMDYGLKHKLGNLLNTHYNDLNRNEIVVLSNCESSDCICRSCEIMKKCQ